MTELAKVIALEPRRRARDGRAHGENQRPRHSHEENARPRHSHEGNPRPRHSHEGNARHARPDDRHPPDDNPRHRHPDEETARDTHPHDQHPPDDNPRHRHPDEETEPPVALGPGPADTGITTFEGALLACCTRIDGRILRELVDDPETLAELRDEIGVQLTDETDNEARARLLGLRAIAGRLLGELDRALGDARLALAHAEATHELRPIALAQARLARVCQWRGEYGEADRLLAAADSAELPPVWRAWTHWYAATSCIEQGRHAEMCEHLQLAYELSLGLDTALPELVDRAVDALHYDVWTRGWGPPPRDGDEIAGDGPAPQPFEDGSHHRRGFAGLPATYVEVRPFHEGVAWVRRSGVPRWELIDGAGRRIIEPIFAEVGVFAHGLCWVTVDGDGWVAIDKTGALAFDAAFDDARPFGRDVAVVRRGRWWGAVDRSGRLVVPCEWDAIRTPIAGGPTLDGFTDGGWAVVERDGRKGVVRRDGEVLVPPWYRDVLVTPTAFLVTSFDGMLGGIDRTGAVVVPPGFMSPARILAEVERAIPSAGGRPVL